MRAIAKRRLLKAWQVIRAAITLGRYAIPNDRAREVLTRAEGVADALDPHCSSMNVPEAPFVLTARADGRLTLVDPATGARAVPQAAT